MNRLIVCAMMLALAGCGGGGATGSAAVPSTTATAAPGSVAIPGVTTAVAAASGTASTTSAVARHVLASPSASPTTAATTAPTTIIPIPKVVGSYSTNTNWGSYRASLYVWEYNTTTSASIPTASITTAVASGAPVSIQSATADTAGTFGFTNDWVVLFNPPTATGQAQVAVTFPDKTTAQIPVEIYDTWDVQCPAIFSGETSGQIASAIATADSNGQLGNLYHGAPVAATSATADVYIDCSGLNIVFPHGAVLAQPPIADARGITISTIASVTAAVSSVPTTSTSFSIASAQSGTVYVARTGDGSYAKFEPIVVGAGGSTQIAEGLSWHASADGSFSQ